MHFRPVDLVLRAALELGAVVGLALGGLAIVGGGAGIILALGVPIVAGASWATFRVPDDPGPAPVPVPGAARLVLEIVLLGLGALGWMAAGWAIAGILLAVLIVGHYLMTADRVRWLLEGP